MMHRAVFGMFAAILMSCASNLPDHSEFEALRSQSQVRETFGEPHSIDRFSHGPDVPSQADLRRSGLRVIHYERWVYHSKNTKASTGIGNTYIVFRMNDDRTEGFAEGISWIPTESSRSSLSANGT